MLMKTNDKNIHAAHRERVRQKAKKFGFEPMQDHELLEYILFHVIPRADTNPVAHNLINNFGNLLGVLSSSTEELMHVNGVGENAALFLCSLGEFFKRSSLQSHVVKKFTNVQDVTLYAHDCLKFKNKEKLIAICLDEKMHHLSTLHLSKPGKISEAELDLNVAVKELLQVGPRYIVLAHNHVDGSLNISVPDGELTTKLYRMLLTYKIEVLDHIIVTDHDSVSFAQTGLMEKIRNLVEANVNDVTISEKLGFKPKVASDNYYMFDPDIDLFK